MIDTRLGLAIADGLFSVPDDGTIAVLYPPVEAHLDSLPKDRTEIVEGFKSHHDAWTARGFTCAVEPGDGYATVILCLSRAKAESRALIAAAMQLTRGAIVIDGQKTSGVDSILKEMRRRVTLSAPISKAHGKLFVCHMPDPEAFEDWHAGPELTSGGFWTAPGVFSADGIDPASALLAEALPSQLGKQVADWGAGWGFLSAHILTRPDVEVVHLVEAQHMALECAKRNVTDPRAAFHWADATTWQPPERLDTIVMNPPFHNSRAADPGLGQAFVSAAARALKPQGQLWMVANRHLPYEQTLKSSFLNVFEVGGDTRFKLFHAGRPVKPTRR